jgi:hypothetical protein
MSKPKLTKSCRADKEDGVGGMWGEGQEGYLGCGEDWKGSRRVGRSVPGPDKGHNAEVVHTSCSK